MKNFMRRSLAAFFILIPLAVISFFLIPFALDTWVIPVLLKRISLENQHAGITRLTPFAASGTMNFAENDMPTLSVPRFEILFSPSSLLKKQLTALVLDHATLHLNRQDGRIYLRSIRPAPGTDSSPGGKTLPLLPFMVDRLILQQCSVVLHEAQKPDLRLTVSARITPEFSRSAGGSFALESLAGTFILSDALTAKGSLSSSQNETGHVISLTINNGFFMLPERFMPPSTSPAVSGPLSADISLGFDKKSLALRSIDVQGSIRNLRLKNDLAELSGSGEARSFSFSLTGTPAEFDYNLSSLEMISPLPLTTSIIGSASIFQEVFSTKGQIQTIFRPEGFGDDLQVPVSLDYSGNYSAGGQWQLILTGQSRLDDTLTLNRQSLSIDLSGFTLSTTLQGGQDGLKADLRLDLAPVELRYNKSRSIVSGLDLHLRAHRNNERITARLEAVIPDISLPEAGYFADNLRVDLPLEFPFKTKPDGKHGTFSVAALGHKLETLASAEGSVTQREESFDLAADVKAAFQPDLALTLKGAWLPLDKLFDLAWNLPATLLESYSLPSFLEIPDNYDFGAEIETDGHLRYSNNQLTGTMRTSLRDGHLSISDKNITLENINCVLENPRLPELISTPSQSCTVENIGIGTFNFSDATVTYRLEDARTLFIENSSVMWSQGSLESGSMRLRPNDMEIDTTIYCNRVNFADLLNQFGFEQTEGEGALNGKLPVKITRNGVHFDDGFLFSTPGTGGIVRFTNTDLLRQGMGGATQAGYLSYSLMALEDFAYNWTRLSFNSSGGDLLMSMELDGKPSSPLPFSFKNGMIVETDQGKGLQYPLRLDVNFRLPLNELLQVGRNIKSIMGNN